MLRDCPYVRLNVWLCVFVLEDTDNAAHQVPDIREIEPFGTVPIDGDIETRQRVLDEDLPHPPAHAPFAVEGRRSHDRVRESENLVIGDDHFFAGVFQGPVDAQRLARRFFRHDPLDKVPVDHARREIDEMFHAQPWRTRRVERILQRSQAVIEGGIRILIGFARVRDGGQMNHRLGLEAGHDGRQPVIVAGIGLDERDAVLTQQIEPLLDDLQIERAVRNVIRPGLDAVVVIDGQAVDDERLGPQPLQMQGQVVADKAGSADQSDSSSGHARHVTSPQRSPTSPVRRYIRRPRPRRGGRLARRWNIC